jgi:RNA recognition motif-containing protein
MASFMQIYIGNLNVMTTAHQLANLFLPFGSVRLSRIVCDKKTGRSLGFGFIEMDTKCAKSAIRKLNRFLFMNSYMEVKEV